MIVLLLFQAQLEHARFCHIPLGNITADAAAFACDVFYARNLEKNNHVLWLSPGDRPDLGGKEDDENRYILSKLESYQSHDQWRSQLFFPTMLIMFCLYK